MKYSQYTGTRQTPQNEPVFGREDQVENNAGGFVFQLDKWDRLLRFLVLGSEGGTYYVKEEKLTVRNAKNVLACIKEDGERVVGTVVDVSVSGRAPRQSPTLFVLALCAAQGDQKTRQAAFDALPQVCRTGTHLFQFNAELENMRGWGRMRREAVAKWYTAKPLRNLAYQTTKYQSRGGWSHRDLLRLSHPKAEGARDDLFGWIVGKRDWDVVQNWTDTDLDVVYAHEAAKRAGSEKEIVSLIVNHGLVRESIPTKWLNSRNVWEALLQKMPMTALLRNLGKMSQIDLLTSMSAEAVEVAEKLVSDEYWNRNWAESRFKAPHPFQILLALTTYSAGKGVRGKLSWAPARQIVDALDEMFYKSFGAVIPTNKRIMLALDVSGSMGAALMNTHITAAMGTAAMAMVTARTEKRYMTTMFSASGENAMGTVGYRRGAISEFPMSPRQRLDDIVRTARHATFGPTDCALPMLYAGARNLEFDAFVVYTDNETWAGGIHPFQALKQYRDEMGIPARLVVVGMTSSGFTIADPNDPGMLDVVGFDSAAPNVIADFIR